MIYGLRRWTNTLHQIANELPEAFLFMARPEGDGKGFHHIATAAFIIRKITESKAHKHNKFGSMQIKAREISPLSGVDRDVEFDKRYDFNSYKKVTLSIRDICNHVVHSEIYSQTFSVSGKNGESLNSPQGNEWRFYFRISSEIEFKKTGKIYEIDLNDYISLVRGFASLVSVPSEYKP